MLKKLFLLLCLLMMCASARATTITISTQSVPGWNYGTPATMRVYVNSTYTDTSGVTHLAQATGGPNFYISVACTASGTTLTIPSFTIASTTDSPDNPSATVSFIFYDKNGVRRDTWAAAYQIPTVKGTTITWATLRIFMAGHPNPPRPGFPDQQQVQAMINLALPCPNASDVIIGCSELSVAPVLSNLPKAVGANDPKVTADQAANVASIRTLGTGALQAMAGNASAPPLVDSPILVTLSYSGDGSLIVGKLVKIVGGLAVKTAITDTGGCIGVVQSGATNTVAVVVGGRALALIDSVPATVGDYVVISNATSGNVKSVGASYPTNGQVIGRVIVGSADFTIIDFFGTEVRVSAASVFNVKDYGAVGDGVTDDTVAILAALTAAQAARGTLYFPGTLLVGGGSYLVSGSGAQIFLVTKPIQIRGDGKYNSVVLVKNTTGATTHIFVYQPIVADLDSRGFAFRDLGVNYQSATHGRHSLVLDATNTFIAQFDIADNFFGVGAGASVVLTNPSNFVDGVFTGTIERNLMLKAPIVDRGGDTLRFVGNTISGPVGNSFDITIVSGATTFTLDGNNITCDGTSITSTGVQSALKTIIQNNIFETSQAGATGHRGALLDIAGSAAANSQLYAFTVQNNQFNSVAPAVLSGVISSYTKGLVVQGNGYVLPAGQRLLLEDHGTDTVMRDNYNIGGGSTEWASNGAGNNFVSVAPWRPVLVSELPTSPTDTMQATVTDSNTAVWGAVVAGGGANNVRVRWNGAAWTVTGK